MSEDSSTAGGAVAAVTLVTDDGFPLAAIRYKAADPDHVVIQGAAVVLAARRGDSAAAAQYLAGGQPWDRGQRLLYRARVAAIQQRPEEAWALLSQAVASGVAGWHWVHGTSWHDFESLHDDARFQRLLGASIGS